MSSLTCLNGSEIKNATSYVPIKTDDSQVQAPVVTANHWFLEAGFVQVQSISASNLRDASIDSTGLANPRIVVKSHGKARYTMTMTNAVVNAETNSYQWNDDIRLPVVDE